MFKASFFLFKIVQRCGLIATLYISFGCFIYSYILNNLELIKLVRYKINMGHIGTDSFNEPL